MLTIETMKPYIITLLSLLAGFVKQVAGTFVIFIEDYNLLFACPGEGVGTGSGNSCSCMINLTGAGRVTPSDVELSTSNFSVVGATAGTFCGQDQLDFYQQGSEGDLVFYIHNGDGSPSGTCTPQNEAVSYCAGAPVMQVQIAYECFDNGAICSS
jgi:hypothetical protein